MVLKNYFLGVLPKRVPWSGISWFRVHRLTLLGGKWRLAGLGLSPVWFSADMARHRKDYWIELSTGGIVRAGFSPRDSRAVVALLREKGVPQRAELA
jgi:hypothetical protein